MKSALTAILASLATAAGALALPHGPTGPAPSSFTDGLYGLSIRPPRFSEPADGASVTRAFFAAPPSSNFAANVNVFIQKRTTTLDEYLKTSAEEFERLKFKMISETRGKVSGRDAVTVDYEGTLQGRELRWHAVVVVEKTRVIQVTCTALKTNFEDYEKEFKDCLESLSLAE